MAKSKLQIKKREPNKLVSLNMLEGIALYLADEIERYMSHADTGLKLRLRNTSLQAKKLAGAIHAIPRPKPAEIVKPAPWWKRAAMWVAYMFRGIA